MLILNLADVIIISVPIRSPVVADSMVRDMLFIYMIIWSYTQHKSATYW